MTDHEHTPYVRATLPMYDPPPELGFQLDETGRWIAVHCAYVPTNPILMVQPAVARRWAEDLVALAELAERERSTDP